MTKVRRICTQQADPPIPFALYAAKDMYIAELYDMDRYLKVSVLALLMDRDESFVEEATEILDGYEDKTMRVDFDFAGSMSEFQSKLDNHVSECESCAEKFKEDVLIGDMNVSDCITREDHVRMITEFRKRVKGRYCIDVSSVFPELRVSNHAEMLENIHEAMRLENEDDFVFLTELILEGYDELKILGRGGPTFAKQLIKSIYES